MNNIRESLRQDNLLLREPTNSVVIIIYTVLVTFAGQIPRQGHLEFNNWITLYFLPEILLSPLASDEMKISCNIPADCWEGSYSHIVCCSVGKSSRNVRCPQEERNENCQVCSVFSIEFFLSNFWFLELI